MIIQSKEELAGVVKKAIAEVKLTDVHTHIYTPCFGDLLLWGVDELVTYHYLIAETFRWIDMDYDEFYQMSKKQQAELIWQTLFIDNSPFSESCRGVLTTLSKLGLDTASRDLDKMREFFASIDRNDYIDLVFEKGGIKDVVMTNNPFDPQEYPIWIEGYEPDERFKAALRIDSLMLEWEKSACGKLKSWGYNVDIELNKATLGEIKRFLTDWSVRMDAVYMAASLPPEFRCPSQNTDSIILEGAIIPACIELDIPFAMMIGTKRLVNPGLRLAGDSVAKGDLKSIDYLCMNYPHNKFMLTMLARENQHEATVTARKFRNLFLFGCWWFLNNPSLIDEMTRMRFELLGPSVLPQHSDARVLDQLVYKWAHSKLIIGDILCEKYADLMDTGWQIDADEITRDVEKLFGGNFWAFLKRKF